MSWVIEAIEKAALEQAFKSLNTGSHMITVRGLSVDQIMLLADHYRRTTGKQPEEITKEEIYGHTDRPT